MSVESMQLLDIRCWRPFAAGNPSKVRTNESERSSARIYQGHNEVACTFGSNKFFEWTAERWPPMGGLHSRR
jgi:hypothetical protein